MRKPLVAAVTAVAVLLLAGAAAARQASQTPPQPKPDRAKILGTWNLEVYADGTYVYLTLAMEEVEGKLAGKVSEQNGMFTDAALGNIEYTGPEFSAEMSVPSPPDGAVKSWTMKLKMSDEAGEGTIANADLGMIATLTAKRIKK